MHSNPAQIAEECRRKSQGVGGGGGEHLDVAPVGTKWQPQQTCPELLPGLHLGEQNVFNVAPTSTLGT